MKDKINKAGFPSQAEFARQMSICPESICGWNNKPEKCPKVYGEYLNLLIRYDVLKIENIALREALRTFKQHL